VAGLTTHALDTAHGRPAAGMTVDLFACGATGDRLVRSLVTNRDGRTDAPLLAADELQAGRYRLLFPLGDYFEAAGGPTGLFDRVPIEFVIADPSQHYHVPLLASPFGYSTYRGS
jgi:5-hydroxyisourate hydrolase